jgi:hypothetical protein
LTRTVNRIHEDCLPSHIPTREDLRQLVIFYQERVPAFRQIARGKARPRAAPRDKKKKRSEPLDVLPRSALPLARPCAFAQITILRFSDAFFDYDRSHERTNAAILTVDLLFKLRQHSLARKEVDRANTSCGSDYFFKSVPGVPHVPCFTPGYLPEYPFVNQLCKE